MRRVDRLRLCLERSGQSADEGQYAWVIFQRRRGLADGPTARAPNAPTTTPRYALDCKCESGGGRMRALGEPGAARGLEAWTQAAKECGLPLSHSKEGGDVPIANT